MKLISGSVLMIFLFTGSALVGDGFFITGGALAQNNTEGCDVTVDIADIDSRDTPLALRAEQSLCLDSHQIETWFIDQGGWSNALTKDNRYWRLTPPGPSRAIFTLMLPSGNQRKLEVIVDPMEKEN